MRYPLCLALAALPAMPAAAQSGSQSWTTVALSAPLGGGWRGQADAVGRIGTQADGLYELEASATLVRDLGRGRSAGLGYVHDPNWWQGRDAFTERRVRLHGAWDRVARLGAVRLDARLRGELRWRDRTAGTGWRLRPGLRAALPVAATVTLAYSHESFVNLNDAGWQQPGYDRMRNALTLATPVARRVQLEGGYLHQWRRQRLGPLLPGQDHAATLALSVAL